ncbi:hypothetical protein, partial [Cronobacter malonaticus]|uniref:hypothetical protein n=1 Tax=Cronobacter malonaticus TaxID=413503 RepID=UPI001E3399A8
IYVIEFAFFLFDGLRNLINRKNPTEITSGYIIVGLKKPLQIIRTLQRHFITAITAAWRWRFAG